MPTVSPQRGASGRVTALDGLRGLAALVVVLGHVMLATSQTFATAIAPVPAHVHGAVNGLLFYTPLHVAWNGDAAVIVFFVLSGFVLTLPVATGRDFRPLSYYPRRLVRLYVPVWGALLLAAAAHELLRHADTSGATSWLAAQATQPTLHDFAASATLTGADPIFALLPVLWSLHWEVIFSLLLPAFVLVARASRSRLYAPGAAAAACCVVLVSGRHGTAQFLPSFFLGALLAFARDDIEVARTRLAARTRRNDAAKLGLLAACVLSLTAVWWLRVDDAVLTDHHFHEAMQIARPLTAIGACLGLLLPLLSSSARRLLESPAAQWVGIRSYSLYLVHYPVLIVVAFALGGAPSTLLLAVVAVPLSLAVTDAFFRVVERPALRLARQLGDLSAGAARRAQLRPQEGA
jgi:peptidoglycan/LPS O-acetylase OafA/YrhL